MDREPYIPYEISDLAINYSIPLIFIAALVSLAYNQKILGFTQFVVYVTSILHWSHIEKCGFYRSLDQFCVVICILWCTYVATYLLPNIRYIWYYSIGTSIAVFVVNEFVFFIGMDYCKTKECITYMTYQSVIIHMIFLHILTVFAGIYCVIMGKPCDNI